MWEGKGRKQGLYFSESHCVQWRWSDDGLLPRHFARIWEITIFLPAHTRTHTYIYIYVHCTRVCVDHLHRCKTSLFSWRLCFVFYQFCIIIAGGTGPLWIPVPTKLFHNGGSGDWSPPCTCTNFHFRQWRPAKPSTGMSFKTVSISALLSQSGIFIFWVLLHQNLLQSKDVESIPRTEFHDGSTIFSCQTLLDCLCTFDAFHISNSIRYFWASVSLIPLSDKVVWALRGKPF